MYNSELKQMMLRNVERVLKKDEIGRQTLVKHNIHVHTPEDEPSSLAALTMKTDILKEASALTILIKL